MNVPANIKQRVEQKLRDGIAIAEAHYNQKFAMPTLMYKKGGATAGTADYCKWLINFNPELLVQNVEDFIARTVPHELAHLITDRVYPEAHQGGITITRFGRYRRKKRNPHGSQWQSVMRVLGVQDSTRCHSYDVSNVARKKASYNYKCGCGFVLALGPKRHRREQAKPGTYWHRTCRGVRLTFQAMTPASKPKKVPAQTKAPKAGSKLARAYKLYTDWHSTYSRQELINVFRQEIGMTEAGASTYVYQCQKMYNAGSR